MASFKRKMDEARVGHIHDEGSVSILSGVVAKGEIVNIGDAVMYLHDPIKGQIKTNDGHQKGHLAGVVARSNSYMPSSVVNGKIPLGDREMARIVDYGDIWVNVNEKHGQDDPVYWDGKYFNIGDGVLVSNAQFLTQKGDSGLGLIRLGSIPVHVP